MANTNNLGSGYGTRPTTDGGVDNVGAAGSFTPGKGKRNEPALPEKLSEVKKNRDSARRDDSAPMG
jgi:hypothetical protein